MKENYKIAVLPGDGIGPEVTSESVKILKVVASVFNYNFQFDYGVMGAEAIYQTGNPLPDGAYEKEMDVIVNDDGSRSVAQ